MLIYLLHFYRFIPPKFDNFAAASAICSAATVLSLFSLAYFDDMSWEEISDSLACFDESYYRCIIGSDKSKFYYEGISTFGNSFKVRYLRKNCCTS